MSEDTTEKSPILNPLKTNLTESPTAPGKIIRTQTIKARNDTELDEAMEEAKRGFSVYIALRDAYGIRIPGFSYEVRDRRATGYATLYTEVEKIEGDNLKEAVLPRDASNKLDDFYKTIVDYYSDIFAKGGDYWGDFRNDQLVYGHRQGETENEVYVVDLDTSNIAIVRYDKSNKGVSNQRLFQQFFNLAYAITEAESKLGTLSNLPKARQEFLSKVSTIPEAEPHCKILQEAKKLFLEKK